MTKSIVMASAGTDVTPTQGSSYEGGYYAGVMKVGTKYYRIILSDSSVQASYSWGPLATALGNAFRLNDGYANTEYLVNSGSSVPAASYCWNLVYNGYSDWYLPAVDEMNLIYRVFKPTSTLNNITDIKTSPYIMPYGRKYTTTYPSISSFTGLGFNTTVGSAGYYWTSTVTNNDNARVWNFANAETTSSSRSSSLFVRPIRRVEITEAQYYAEYKDIVFISSTSWVVPAGVTSVSMLAIGTGGWAGQAGAPYTGGGGGGGGLSYVNNVAVTPGETLTINIGAAYGGPNTGLPSGQGTPTNIKRGSTVLCEATAGFTAATGYSGAGGAGGTATVGTGGTGGSGATGAPSPTIQTGGGGGAAGYSGSGGNGAVGGSGSAGSNGSGGGGGGGYGGQGGGGVGLFGSGTSGTGGASYSSGSGGSGGNDGWSTSDASFGGGGGGGGGPGAGAVRIMWGTGKSFPSSADPLLSRV